MSEHWEEYQRRRWMKPNAHLWMRPDAERWLMPNQRVWQGPKNWEGKYLSDQARVPAGNPDGGPWTSEDGDGLGQSSDTASDQERRSDLSDLENIANLPNIQSEIASAWTASLPSDAAPQEHGFWISKDLVTGEIFTRPFSGAGGQASIVPGRVPDDAIAFFHTHPNEFGYDPGPSRADLLFAERWGIPGILRSHRGLYYFGPKLR